MTMEELLTAVEVINGAFAQVLAVLEQVAELIADSFDSFRNKESSPRRYDLLVLRKRRYLFPHYQYIPSIQRNLPYQRRIF